MKPKIVCKRFAVIPGALLLFSAALFAAVDGQAVYLDKCAVCHGQDGLGKTAKGKKLKVKSVKDTIVKEDEAAMTKIVVDGKGSDMDSFKGELNPEQIKAVVAYYRGLAK